MTIDDLPASRTLLAQLGYPMDARETRQRHDAVTGSGDHALLVAEQDGRVIAFCHVFIRPALDKPPEAVVQALVVDQSCRGNGVGKIMMQAVETWAVEKGFASVALMSHVSRQAAHAFYGALGYRQEAVSVLFRKTLLGPEVSGLNTITHGPDRPVC
jgi:GNAT superfamily N-acetyltransferase